MPAPCKLTFDLESGVRVSCDVGYLCANFSLSRPICSRLRCDVRDRQTSDAHHRLMPPPYGGGGITSKHASKCNAVAGLPETISRIAVASGKSIEGV